MVKVKDSVKREIVVAAPLEKVWQALTTEEHLNRWYTKDATIDFRVGGRGYMNHGWGSISEGTYTEIEKMRRFVLQSDDGDFTTITELEVVENGVRVSIEYRASYMLEMDEASKENMMFGTGQFLENLKRVYETGQDNREKLWRTWIGISHRTSRDNMGTEIVTIQEGSAAERAGLITGDILVNLGDYQIHDYESFERVLNQLEVNQVVTLKVLRGEAVLEVECLVEPYPVQY